MGTLAQAQKNPPARGSPAAAPLHQGAKGRSPIRLWACRHPPAGGKVNPQGHNGERTPGAKATADATAKRNRRHPKKFLCSC